MVACVKVSPGIFAHLSVLLRSGNEWLRLRLLAFVMDCDNEANADVLNLSREMLARYFGHD